MQWLKTVLALGLCLGVSGCKAEAAPLFEDRPAERDDQESMIYVDIEGAVRNPGVYKLRNGRRLVHLVEVSGGFTEDAVLDGLTLSVHLEDGVRYAIPSALDEAPSDLDEEGNVDEADPGENTQEVSINTASAETLETLPGIGPATAQAIIDHREEHGDFEAIEGLMEVRNIGEKTFEALEALITLQP